MKLSPKQIGIALGAVALVVVLIILLTSGAQPPKPPKVSLSIWGVSDDEAAFEGVLRGYKQFRQNVTVSYRKVDERNYESVLLDALAAGSGPDVFMVHNRSLPKAMDKLVPVVPEQLNLARLRELFPTVVEQDFTAAGQIYALPLFIDTLALFYNKDRFDEAGIVSPPKTWDKLQAMVPELRSVNPAGQIVKAAAAIGGSEKTVHAGVDLLHLLMMQNGTAMTNAERLQAVFDAGARGGNPGFHAFNFYLQFANAASPVYTWNDSEAPDTDSFTAGQTAMMFGYERDTAGIAKKNPFLNFGVALVPQPTGSEYPITYADYWGLAVSKQSKASGWAWDFIVWLTTNPESVKAYLDATRRPPALRSVIGERLDDPDIGMFAKQALTARSWYQVDAAGIREIFNAAITSVLSGKATPERALRGAQDQVSQLMRQ